MPRNRALPSARAIAAVLLLAFVLLALPTRAATPEALAAVDRMLAAAYPADRPGAAVIIVEDGKTLLRKGYGLANAELGVPIEPDMVFRLGSITKQFTAVAVLMLVEEGKIDLAAPITTYLPDFPTHGKTITVEQLLQHVSGVKSYTELDEWPPRWREDMTVAQIIDLFEDKPGDFEPGTDWHYSNSGYILLGAILEKVSGRSYADFVRERIFQPLGMTHSWYDDPAKLIPRRVAGYEVDGDGFRPADYLSMTQPYAAGSLASNVDDLARWYKALGQGKVLTAASRERMWTSGRLADGRATHYGYGWGIWQYEGHRVIEHSGGINGFSTEAIWLPEDKLFIAVLTNLAGPVNPEVLALKSATRLIGKPLDERPAVKLPPEVLDRYVGVYEIGGKADDVRIVTREGDRLTSQRSGGDKLPLKAKDDHTFFFDDTMTLLRFEMDAAGKVTRMVAERNVGVDDAAIRTDRPIPAPRQAVAIDPALLPGLVGKYSLAPGFVLAVTLEGTQLYAQASGQPKLALYPESPTRFFLQEVDAVIEFVRGADGKAESLTLFQGGEATPAKRVQ